jgi:hypothetical protein
MSIIWNDIVSMYNGEIYVWIFVWEFLTFQNMFKIYFKQKKLMHMEAKTALGKSLFY